MSNTEDPHELKSFEALLAALAPREDRLDRERLIFLAGQASVSPAVTWRRHPAWPAAFATMSAIAATLLFVLVTRPIPNQLSPAGTFEIATANRSGKSPQTNAKVTSAVSVDVLSARDAMAGDIEQRLTTLTKGKSDPLFSVERSEAQALLRPPGDVLTTASLHLFRLRVRPTRPLFGESIHDVPNCTINYDLRARITFGGVAQVFGEETAKPVKITLHPQPAPNPSLKYRLLPTRLEQKRGNAVVHYGKVTAEEITFFSDNKLREKIDDWQETPLEELRGGKVKLPSKGAIEDSIRRGALCMECDWLLPVGDVPYYQMLLPDVQQSRGFGRILAVRARIQIADHEYDDAVTTLQTGYALGRHVATGETIVNGLVGNAICGIMNAQLLEYVQQLGAPNLYWALTALPYPMIDMQRALDVERMGVELSFPELTNAHTAKKTPDEWHEHFVRIFSQDLGVQLSDNNTPKWWPAPEELDKRCRERLPAAKKTLIASGLPAKDVEAMPMYQIATLYTLALYHEHLDNSIKYYSLPYPAAIAGMDAANERAKHDDREIVPLSKRLVPVIGINRSATARLERMFAILRVLEALRLHAANHGDKLPNALADVTDVPVPEDPVTGKPFDYERKGDVAYLRGPMIRDTPLNYEITMVSRH